MQNQFSEAARQARREYQKKWRERNGDKINQYQARFWEKKAVESAMQKEEAKNA